MKVFNDTEKMISFQDGKRAPFHRWYHIEPGKSIEIPDELMKLAKIHNLRVGEIPKSKKEKPKEVPEEDGSDSNESLYKLLKKLTSIKGIGKKIANEILEEYDSLDSIKEAINDEIFEVGGIDDKKMELILDLE